MNDIDDVERLIPGTVSLIREWFRTYKIPDGKPPNKFALDEKCMGAKYAHKVIHETHTFWCDLVQKQLGDDFGFQLPKLETLRGVANDSKMVRKISNPDLRPLASCYLICLCVSMNSSLASTARPSRPRPHVLGRHGTIRNHRRSFLSATNAQRSHALHHALGYNLALRRPSESHRCCTSPPRALRPSRPR